MVALVRGLHGIGGAVRVEVLTDRPEERFAVGATLFREGSDEPLAIAEARPANPGWILRFGDVRTREAAEAFRDVYLEAAAGHGFELPRGSYYWHEMIGATVRDPAGDELGTVRDVYRAGGGDVLDVAGGPRGDFDVPIARPFVRILAPRRGEIVVDPEALDLPSVDEIRPPRPPRPPRPRRATRRRPAVPMAPRPGAQAGADGAPGDTGLPAPGVPAEKAEGTRPPGPPDAAARANPSPEA